MGIVRVIKSSAILFAALSVFIEATSCNFNRDLEWKAFKCNYNKIYPCERKEFEAYNNFLQNKADVETQNLKYAMNQSTYFYGLNENSDIDAKTWIKETKWRHFPSNSNCSHGKTTHRRIRSKRAVIPISVDYDNRGLTTSVKNQGLCGSCYSFAVAAALESIRRLDLSNQQIVDCTKTVYGNFGCNGGYVDKSFDFVRDNKGLPSDETYPYREQVGACRLDKPIVTTVLGHRRYVKSSVEKLKTLLASRGPVVCAINSLKSLSSYRGGIYTSPQCNNTQMDQLNHALLLVGYGMEDGQYYWKLKNSWGRSWGRDGYLYISQDCDCGVTLDVYVPGSYIGDD